MPCIFEAGKAFQLGQAMWHLVHPFIVGHQHRPAWRVNPKLFIARGNGWVSRWHRHSGHSETNTTWNWQTAQKSGFKVWNWIKLWNVRPTSMSQCQNRYPFEESKLNLTFLTLAFLSYLLRCLSHLICSVLTASFTIILPEMIDSMKWHQLKLEGPKNCFKNQDISMGFYGFLALSANTAIFGFRGQSPPQTSTEPVEPQGTNTSVPEARAQVRILAFRVHTSALGRRNQSGSSTNLKDFDRPMPEMSQKFPEPFAVLFLPLAPLCWNSRPCRCGGSLRLGIWPKIHRGCVPDRLGSWHKYGSFLSGWTQALLAEKTQCAQATWKQVAQANSERTAMQLDEVYGMPGHRMWHTQPVPAEQANLFKCLGSSHKGTCFSHLQDIPIHVNSL